MPNDFITEDDLDTFEGWLRYQAVDPNTPDLSQWRSTYDEAIKKRSPAVGLMKVRRSPRSHLYAVARLVGQTDIGSGLRHDAAR
jgi:hypothetical protein